MDAGESPPTALERSERRPTGTILFLAALFALPAATCGGIGASKASDARSPIVSTTPEVLNATDSAGGDQAAIEDGAYVSFVGTLRHVATDELPVGDGLVVAARGTGVYAVDGVEGIVVASQDGPLPSGEPLRIGGRLCSADAHLACSIDPGLKTFLRAEEKRAARPVSVISAGAAPSENIVEACIGLGVAAFLALGFLAAAVFIVRGRRGPHISVERAVAVQDASEPLRIAERLGPQFRVARATEDALVLLTGVPASRAQLVGAWKPDECPQRVEITLVRAGYRGPSSAHVRVSEILAQPSGPTPQIVPAIRAALEATLERVTCVLQAP